MPWYAHSRKGRPKGEWETQLQHAGAVAGAACTCAEKFGMGPLGAAAGCLHDLGKYVRAFQDYIDGTGRAAKGPDHASAGAVYARQHLGRLGLVVAHAVAGHHTGLKDGLLDRGQRLDRNAPNLPAIRRAAEADGFVFPGPLPAPAFRLDPTEEGFQFAVLTRLLFSCLVDADQTETERFYTDGTVDRGFTATPADLAAALHGFMRDKDAARAREGTAALRVNRLRARVLDHVAAGAGAPPGIFTLTVPTGGGKTLTALRFALDHAAAHQLDRVIVVIPFTSVIEQTAEVYREALAPHADQILEHHSGFEDDDAEAGQDKREGRSALRLATETWAAPLVVTTAVQFFESLFAAKGARCRKLHNIARSVIVLDEAQTIPLHLLRPCVAMLKELQRNYGVSVVLCTATQPALADNVGEGRSFAGGFVDPKELAPEPEALFRALDRVTIRQVGKQDDATLVETMRAAPQALCIVNSRKHARDLYRAISNLEGARHLSTLMLPAHRRRVLAEIKADLPAGKPCRVVSTSLVEAGVDFSFPLVLRAEAGLEQIVQAAGRANRNGELGEGNKGEVLVFEAADHAPLRAMVANVEAAREILRHHNKPDLPAAIRRYFELLYWRRCADLDRHGVLESCENAKRDLTIPFETIAREMRLIDDMMRPIIVPLDDEAREAVEALRHVEKPGRLARILQRHTVGVPPGAITVLVGSGAAEIVRQDLFGTQFVVLRNMDLYKGDVGLTWDDPTFIEAEKLVF